MDDDEVKDQDKDKDEDQDKDKNRKKINFRSKWGNTENLANMIPSIGVGIAELIKNSYDADAENVLVELRVGSKKILQSVTS